MKQPISACIMTKNEENVIAQCIDSISPYVEEVIVLDTGSIDKTVEIAKCKKVIVEQTSWNNSFSLVRNELIRIASKPVILMIDADEILVADQQELLERSYNLVVENNSMIGRLSIINQTENNETTRSSVARLFSNSTDIFFEGAVHEQIHSKTRSLSYFDTELKVMHDGYSKERVGRNNKIQRNLELLFSELRDKPEDSYLNFQIGRTYSVNGEHDKAEHYLNKAYRSANGNEIFHSTIIQTYGWTLLENSKFETLLALLYSAIDKYPDYTDLYFLYGCALTKMKSVDHIDLIPGIFEACIALGEPDSRKYETVSGVGSYKAYYNLGVFKELTGDKKGAIAAYQESSLENYKPAVDRLQLITNE